MSIFPTGKPHVSYSEIRNWHECSWRHKLLYIDKIDVQKPSPNLHFGTLVHAECESYLTNRTFDLDRLEAAIRKVWTENSFEDVEGWIKSGRQAVEEVPDFLETEFPGWEIMAAEHPLYEMIENELEIKFKGFVDGMIRYKDKKGNDLLAIIDWKTSGPGGWNAEKRRDMLVQAQLALYKIFCAKKLEIDHKEVRCFFVLLKRNVKKGKSCEIIPISVGPKTVEKSNKLVTSMITGVRAGKPLKNFSSCKFCDYRGTTHCKGSENVYLER
jgi:hypothetical protein